MQMKLEWALDKMGTNMSKDVEIGTYLIYSKSQYLLNNCCLSVVC